MILTEKELALYRGLVGLQLKYAEDGDGHKVVEMQTILMNTIRQIAERKIILAAGQGSVLGWSDAAKSKYATLCAEGLKAAGDGFEAWKLKQYEIEAWVSSYIEQAILQASIPVIGINKRYDKDN